MEGPGYLGRFIAAGLVVVAGVAAHRLPRALAPRLRMLEVVPIALLLLGAAAVIEAMVLREWGDAGWYVSVSPFCAASFLIVRTLRSIPAGAGQASERLKAEPELGAHALYLGPLLALAVATAWSSARGNDGSGWIVSGLWVLFGVQSRQQAYRSAALSSVGILASAVLTMR